MIGPVIVPRTADVASDAVYSVLTDGSTAADRYAVKQKFMVMRIALVARANGTKLINDHLAPLLSARPSKNQSLIFHTK